MLPPPEFRAPPPSPVAGAHPHAPGDSKELASFLAQFLHVPKLNLPHHIFPRKPRYGTRAEIDFRTLISPDAARSEADLLKSAATAFGCFRLANHGIPLGLIATVRGAAALAFRMPPEEKVKVAKLLERSWGFEAEEDADGVFALVDLLRRESLEGADKEPGEQGDVSQRFHRWKRFPIF